MKYLLIKYNKDGTLNTLGWKSLKHLESMSDTYQLQADPDMPGTLQLIDRSGVIVAEAFPEELVKEIQSNK